MGLFSRNASAPVAPAPVPAPSGAGTAPVGVINLTKGQGVNLTKTPLVTATISWPPATDYDVYALVLYRDGRMLTVSAFGTKDKPKDFAPTTPDGAVKHLGDVQRGSEAVATETVEIRLNPEIVAVVPVAYSAQSNGTGSFRAYRVSMRIDNGAGQSVVVDASHASKDKTVYTCVPGIVLSTSDGVRVEALELYSAPGSERRPVVGPDLRVVMDDGPVNAYK